MVNLRLGFTFAFPISPDALVVPFDSLGSHQYLTTATQVSRITFTPSAEKETKGSKMSPNHLKRK